jgi:major type 1 subunit fimbrin (pilin)
MNRTLLAFAALASTLAMSVAQANDGTINFTGELTAQTCTSTVNGAASTTVALPRLSTAALAAAGQSAGATAFTIELSRCTGTMTTAAAYFEAGSNVDPVTRNVRNTNATGARNVQLQLLDSTGAVIRAGDASQTASTARTAFTGTGATAAAVLPYSVQYIATGAATAGTVVGSVTYSINYQ